MNYLNYERLIYIYNLIIQSMAIEAVIALIAVTISTFINSLGFIFIKLSIIHTEK